MTEPIRLAMLYGLLTMTGDDLDSLFKSAADNGTEGILFFINFLDGDNDVLPACCPYVPVGSWNAGGLWDHYVPVYDLSKRNLNFVARMWAIAALFAKYKLIPVVIMEDRCSEAQESTWQECLDPYVCNTYRFPHWAQGDTNHQGGGGNQDMNLNPYKEKLDQDIMDIFHIAGVKEVWGGVKNEYGYDVGPGSAYPVTLQLEWYASRAASLRARGYKVIGSAVPPILTQIDPYIDVYDDHGYNLPSQLWTHPKSIHPTVVNSDGADGHGAVSEFGGHTLDTDEAVALGTAVKAQGYYGICIIFQEVFKRSRPANIGEILSWPVMLAMSKAMGGTPPAPQPQPDPHPQPPVPPPNPPPAPTPTKHGFWYYIAHGNIKKAFKILFGG